MAHWPNASDQIQVWNPDATNFTALEPMNIDPNANGTGKAGFTDGNPGTNAPPSILGSKVLNMLLAEIVEAVIALGATPDEADNTQLGKALKAAFATQNVNTWHLLGEADGQPVGIAPEVITPANTYKVQNAWIASADGRLTKMIRGGEPRELFNDSINFINIIPAMNTFSGAFGESPIWYALSENSGQTRQINASDIVDAGGYVSEIGNTFSNGIFFRSVSLGIECMIMINTFPDVAIIGVRAGQGPSNINHGSIGPVADNKYFWDLTAVYHGDTQIDNTWVYILGYTITGSSSAQYIWKSNQPYLDFTWEEHLVVGAGSLQLAKIGHKDGVFIICGIEDDGSDEHFKIYRSTDDAETWTEVFDTLDVAAFVNFHCHISATDGLFVVAYESFADGTWAMSSLDGQNWDYVHIPATNEIVEIEAVSGKLIAVYRSNPSSNNVWSTPYLRQPISQPSS